MDTNFSFVRAVAPSGHLFNVLVIRLTKEFFNLSIRTGTYEQRDDIYENKQKDERFNTR